MLLFISLWGKERTPSPALVLVVQDELCSSLLFILLLIKLWLFSPFPCVCSLSACGRGMLRSGPPPHSIVPLCPGRHPRIQQIHLPWSAVLMCGSKGGDRATQDGSSLPHLIRDSQLFVTVSASCTSGFPSQESSRAGQVRDLPNARQAAS